MKICPTCGEVYGDQVAHCTSDGQALTNSSDNVPVKEWAVPLGSVVGGYRLTDRLGKGGMGVVYRAEHQRLGKKVAIKMLRPDLATERGLVRRFFDEARAASRIGHDGIVQIFDFIEEGAHRCYVMELLEGHPLGAELNGAPMAPDRVVAIGVQVASALGAAHDAGVIHRDLKPDNVFLRRAADGSEQVKLLDFGIAKLKESDDAGASLTQTGVVLGTPAYMSPEQLEGMKVDARSDVYALGVLLYEMATGLRPFRGRTVAEVILKHVRELPVPPSKAAGVPLPFALETTILACLEKDRERRPQNMRDVASLLEDAPPPRTLELPAAVEPSPAPRAIARAPTHTGATRPVSTGSLSTGELALVRSPARSIAYALVGVAAAGAVGLAAWLGIRQLMAAQTAATAPPVVVTTPEPPVAASPLEPAEMAPPVAPTPVEPPAAEPPPAEPPVATPPAAEPPPAEPPAPVVKKPTPKKPAAARPAPKKPVVKPPPKPDDKPPPKKDTLVDPFG